MPFNYLITAAKVSSSSSKGYSLPTHCINGAILLHVKANFKHSLLQEGFLSAVSI